MPTPKSPKKTSNKRCSSEDSIESPSKRKAAMKWTEDEVQTCLLYILAKSGYSMKANDTKILANHLNRTPKALIHFYDKYRKEMKKVCEKVEQSDNKGGNKAEKKIKGNSEDHDEEVEKLIGTDDNDDEDGEDDEGNGEDEE